MFDKIKFLNTGYLWQTNSTVEDSDTVFPWTGLQVLMSLPPELQHEGGMSLLQVLIVSHMFGR